MKNIFYRIIILLAFNVFCIYKSQNIRIKYNLQSKINGIKVNSSNYYLDINGEDSVFRSETERISDSLRMKTGYGKGVNPLLISQLYIIKNKKNDKITKHFILPTPSRTQMFISITNNLEWKIFPDKQKIGTFDCQKATINYGGRNWIAWFTDYPISEGPYIFGKLPGLVVKISDLDEHYSFQLIDIKKDIAKFFLLQNGMEISWEEFKKIQQDKYIDPFAYEKTRNMPVYNDYGNGIPVKADLREDALKMQQYFKRNNNPLEINHKVIYK